MIGIYKITNLINGKVYIGQSIHIEIRWKEHKYSNDATPLHQAFNKYGIDNFKFEVVEECTIDELNELEIYYIQYFNSLVPNGYNQQYGGVDCRLAPTENILKIIDLIKNSEYNFDYIATQCGVSRRSIIRINQGQTWAQENENYPLRKIKHQDYENLDEDNQCYCIDCHKIITKGAKRCVECANLAQRHIERPSKEELLELVYNYGFLGTGKKFNVSDNAIKKWCISYGLPHLIKDIRELYEKTHSFVKIEKNKNIKHQGVIQFDLNNKEINRFSSCAEAAFEIVEDKTKSKSMATNIGRVCNHERKTAGGYIWEWWD